MEEAVRVSNCWFDCLPKLGIPNVGGNYRTLKNKVREYNIDISHFSYSFAKTHNGKHYEKRVCNRSDKEIFRYGAKIKLDNLKREYIIRYLGGKSYCEYCGITDWNGRPLTFQIHHIDGNHQNHILNNIVLLCPNCHSQTDNYSNRKRKNPACKPDLVEI